MDAHLIDLDALLLRVRDRRVREYLREAVNAYRAGAHKAAVISTWVAVAFDVITKIREIAAAGDVAAAEFIRSFDAAVAASNYNRLLRLEADLLDVASERLGFIGSQELLQLQRLKQDRNFCAHPTFSSEAELFQPSPELVRTHIVHAVDMLLANPAVQGRSIISTFATDLDSSAFPREPEQVVEYVSRRYLDQMRRGVVVNFATVILKALLRGNVPQWAGREERLLYALEAVARTEPARWSEEIRPVALRLMTELDGNHLPAAFRLLRAFPDLYAHVDDALRVRLRSVVQNYDPLDPSGDAVFDAAGLGEYDDALKAALRRAPEDRQIEVLERHPSRLFLLQAMALLGQARSYRGAEGRFRRLIMPMIGFLAQADLPLLLDTVRSNGEIWDAADMPRLLADLVDSLALRRVQLRPEPWLAFRALLEEHDSAERYDRLWTVLKDHKIIT